jgi:hypothetical protein
MGRHLTRHGAEIERQFLAGGGCLTGGEAGMAPMIAIRRPVDYNPTYRRSPVAGTHRRRGQQCRL